MTNGEKLKEVFPNMRIDVFVSYVQVVGKNYEFNNLYPLKWWNAEYKEPTRKTCNSCGNFGSHNGVCDICNPKYNDLWREKPNCSENPTSSTTKNDLGVDCISREQAKEAIRDKFKDLPSRVEINTILNELPSVTPQEPRWIPVSEKLPKEHICDDGWHEPSDYVLVFTKCGCMHVTRWWSRFDERWVDLRYPTTDEVIAWMPLPKAYREVEE